MNTKTLKLLLLIGFTLVIVASAVVVVPAMLDTGATIVVNTIADEVGNNSLCSLREAIRSANADNSIGGCTAGTGKDTILLNAGVYNLSISGIGEDLAATGDLDITDDVVIQGAGADLTTIVGDGGDRIFHVDPAHNGIEVEIAGVALKDGFVPEEDTLGGGGILNEGAQLTLRDIEIRNSRAERGGGVRNSIDGSLEVVDGLFVDNVATWEGGGIYSDGTFSLKRVTLRSNEADRGGGFFADNNVTVQDAAIEGNQAKQGGGIYCDAICTISRASVHGNLALSGGYGGGIYNENQTSLVNVTIDVNIAPVGGGIYNSGDLSLNNVTIYKNTANATGGGIYSNPDGAVEASNTVIAENNDDNCRTDRLDDVISHGHNLDDDQTCDLTGTTDLNGQTAKLGSYQDNGGYSKTHMPLTGSPLIDQGDPTLCEAIDQRGVIRPVYGSTSSICDIGAVEATPNGIIGFEESSMMVNEDQGMLTVSVLRVHGDSGTASIYYYTMDTQGAERAYGGHDYYESHGTLTWGNGDITPKNLTVQIIDDFSFEFDEKFMILLSNPGKGVGIFMDKQAMTVTILDNDSGMPTATPVVSVGGVFIPLVLR